MYVPYSILRLTRSTKIQIPQYYTKYAYTKNGLKDKSYRSDKITMRIQQ